MNTTYVLIIFQAVIAVSLVSAYLPIFKAKSAEDLAAAIRSRPRLARVIHNRFARKYWFSSVLYALAFVLFLIANVNDDENFAFVFLLLIINYGMTMLKTYTLRKLLNDAPADQISVP
jgi:hypothetical protein